MTYITAEKTAGEYAVDRKGVDGMNIAGIGSVPLLPFRTVVRYIATSFVGWLLAGILVLLVIPKLAAGEYQSPMLLAIVHLLILGWATMLAQGAIYQLIPVAFQVGIRHKRIATYNYGLYTIGVAGMVASFVGSWTAELQWFGSVAGLAVLLFAFNVLHSLTAVQDRGPMFGFVFSSVLYLSSAVLFGIGLAIMLQTGVLIQLLPSLLVIHVWMGLIGWFTMLIIGFTYKLFPMFTLSHGFREKRQKWILLLLHMSIVLAAAGTLTSLKPIQIFAPILLLSGILLFGLDVRDIYRHRMRGTLEHPMVMAVSAIGWLGIIVLAALAVQLTEESLDGRWITMLGSMFFLGWLSQTIIGYAYKIVPFLVWNERYSDKVGREPVPLLKDMIDEPMVKWVWVLYNAGLFLANAGMLWKLTGVVYAGMIPVAAAVLVFVYQMVRVIWPSANREGGNGYDRRTASI